LHNVSWEAYVAIGNALQDRPIHLTYDSGNLEIMTLCSEHEGYKSLLRRLVETCAEEFIIPIKNLGSTTQQREDLEKGLEPDECYYIANFKRMRGVRRLDLTRDPPPDLVVEIDITRTSVDRMRIYASLGVPEVWRFDGQTLHVYRLDPSGRYEECDHSPTFPTLPLGELIRFVRLGESEDDTTMVRAFRAWVRQQLTKKRGKPDSEQRGRGRRKK
jgi:Uma2 family endonuclease